MPPLSTNVVLPTTTTSATGSGAGSGSGAGAGLVTGSGSRRPSAVAVAIVALLIVCGAWSLWTSAKLEDLMIVGGIDWDLFRSEITPSQSNDSDNDDADALGNLILALGLWGNDSSPIFDPASDPGPKTSDPLSDLVSESISPSLSPSQSPTASKSVPPPALPTKKKKKPASSAAAPSVDPATSSVPAKPCYRIGHGRWSKDLKKWMPGRCKNTFKADLNVTELNQNGYKWIMFFGDSLTRHLYQAYAQSVKQVHHSLDFSMNDKYWDDRLIHCPHNDTYDGCQAVARGCSLTQPDHPCPRIDRGHPMFMPHDWLPAIDNSSFIFTWKWSTGCRNLNNLLAQLAHFEARFHRLPDALYLNCGLHELLQRTPPDRYRRAVQSVLCQFVHLFAKSSATTNAPILFFHSTTAVAEDRLPAAKKHMRNDNIREYNSIVRDVMDEFIHDEDLGTPAHFVDFFNVSFTRPQTKDGLHYDLRYDRVAQAIGLNFLYGGGPTRRSVRLDWFRSAAGSAAVQQWWERNECEDLIEDMPVLKSKHDRLRRSN